MTNLNQSAPLKGFLRRLASLSLFGGSVTILGAPKAAAEPITDQLHDRYDAWLEIERARLRIERFGREEPSTDSRYELVWHDRETGEIFDHRRDGLLGSGHRRGKPVPSTRAAIVLSAAGAYWR